jgi:hypothetical protein
MSSVRTTLIAAIAAAIISVILVVLLHYKPSLQALVRSAPPAAPADKNDWITNAMTECDGEAEKHPDSLYFLVIPIAPTSKSAKLPEYDAPIEIGKNVLVVTSKELLDGLKDGSLTLYRRPFAFSIHESASNTSYKWDSTGASQLAARQASPLKSFKVGIKLPGRADVEWSTAEFPSNTGTCYWVNALVRE